ncbi:hypothetical protein BH23ACT2_BH23ACT2_06380 [soil metagenome]
MARRFRHVLDDQGPTAALALLGPRLPDSLVAVDAVRIEALAQAGRIVEAHALLAEVTDRVCDVDDRVCVALAHAACDPLSVLAARHEIELLLAAVAVSDPTALLLRTALAEGYAFSTTPEAAVPHLDILFDHLAQLDYSWSARVHQARREHLAAVGAGADQQGIFYAGIVEMAARARTDRDRMPLQRAILGDLYQAGDLNAFAAVLGDYRRIAESTASTADIWCGKAMVAAMALVRDPLDVVMTRIDEAQQYGAAYGHHSAAETADAQLVVALLAHGQLGDVADMVDERTKGQNAVAWRAIAAVALALAGRNTAAAAAIADVRGAGFATMGHDWLRRPALALAAHTAYLLNDRDAARELLPLLAASGVETIAIGNSIANLGPTSRYIGLLHATTGDLELAASGLAAASSLAKRMRSPTYEARCSAELSTLEQAPQRRGASAPAVSVKH